MNYTKESAVKFWDKAEETVGKCPEIDLANKSICPVDIKEAVRHAFRDLTVRTMRKNNDHANEKISLDDLAVGCCKEKDGLFPLLEDWFEKPPAVEFDVWHINACDKVRTFLEKYYIPEDCTYGKAQKIVNMTFKNLYALCAKKDIEDIYGSHFSKCHVPLDSFTLEWFYRECLKHKCDVTKGRILNWSAIGAYGDENTREYTAPNGKNYYTYFHFQQNFRNWYSGMPTPLQAEFVAWAEIQKELTAESFYFSLKEGLSNQKKKRFKGEPLDEKLRNIKQLLNSSVYAHI